MLYAFVGLSSRGHSIWAPRWGDYHKVYGPNELTIQAAIASVGGVRYLKVTSGGKGGCSIYEAGDPNWPAPGPSYVRVGTSGTGGFPQYSLGAGLPIYARTDVDPFYVGLALQLTQGTR